MTRLTLNFTAPAPVVLTEGPALALAFPAPQAVKLQVQGIQGPPGSGGGGARYVHTQGSAATTWTVNHNLGFLPQVTVLSPGGIEVEAQVTHTSANQAVITFNTAQTGQAIFS